MVPDISGCTLHNRGTFPALSYLKLRVLPLLKVPRPENVVGDAIIVAEHDRGALLDDQKSGRKLHAPLVHRGALLGCRESLGGYRLKHHGRLTGGFDISAQRASESSEAGEQQDNEQ